jgi:rod shape determining protein RodA
MQACSSFQKVKHSKFGMCFILIVITLIACVGFLVQYSAAGGNSNPWMSKQIYRFCIGTALMIWVAHTNVRFWFSIAYGLYAIVLLFLFAVDFLGLVRMGAKRWLDFGFFNFQPSELIRVTLVLALGRYFHDLPFEKIGDVKNILIPTAMILIPTFLAMKQPDLGTAILLLSVGFSLFFVAGVRIWKFAVSFFTAIILSPFLWNFLHDYQKKRILIFLNPESDPLNAGYHVMQSKIALGSGGIFGKGFLKGTQSHLNFLPEKQTDFIFAMFCEEFGFIGAVILIFFYVILISYNLNVALKSKSVFGRLVASGLTITFFCYIVVNICMVCGLLPVVGIPLPFVSYGGTALITLLFSQGLVFSVRTFNQKKL